MKKLLVIGIGSRIMMDDAVGIYLVEDLMKVDTYTDVTFVVGETDVDYCIDEILDYDQVIVIDAYLSGKQPGEISILPLGELSKRKEDCLYSTHDSHLLNQLQCKRHSQIVNLIGIEPYEVDYGFNISDPLQQRYLHILSEVSGHIAKYINM